MHKVSKLYKACGTEQNFASEGFSQDPYIRTISREAQTTYIMVTSKALKAIAYLAPCFSQQR